MAVRKIVWAAMPVILRAFSTASPSTPGTMLIDDKHIVGAISGVKDRIAPRGAGIHDMPSRPQPFLDERGSHCVVLKGQAILHRRLPVARIADPLAG